ncbi:PP2C family protein-serine/threonine phosphatase [Brevibacillus humidisoli]|uniref:PP2C family protein-serine/threonine phosphatase n=1 Tax=Brevibacillus humidisoli TaxID=2895522 RepID=UPI001E59E01C|nr:PP2C family protein-serine/threonine phosphatase [Brevibacillus humidisoli]UFJ40948.1 PP2C family protein-serine/threonine phosphatase [Brevibacillus humidisoli]
MSRRQLKKQYNELLLSFLLSGAEDQLYSAQQLGKWLIRHNVAPEDIIDLHLEALEGHVDVPEPVRISFQLLTEIMIEYGIAYREHLFLRNKQQQLESEIEVAVTMQHTLLPASIPDAAGLDIGLISVPSKKMSGDYYNVFQLEDHLLGVAVADIVGKGIPAALSMSMIKYAMDGLAAWARKPAEMLRQLNGVVERNIDSSMFITMAYGAYDTSAHRFRYAVAGHEPGFWYRSRTKRLADLPGSGLALGLQRDSIYEEYELQLKRGDLIILLTDGVTERKVGDHFLRRSELSEYILDLIGLPCQEIVDSLYRKLLNLSNHELPDDHTMIAIRRTK